MYHTRRSLATVCAGSVRVAYFIAHNFRSTIRIMQPLDSQQASPRFQWYQKLFRKISGKQTFPFLPATFLAFLKVAGPD